MFGGMTSLCNWQICATLQSVVSSVIDVIVFKESAIIFYIRHFSPMRESALVMGADGEDKLDIFSPPPWSLEKIKIEEN
jgi:hypothetical protein